MGGLGLAVIDSLLPRTDLRRWADEVGRLRRRFVDELRPRSVSVDDTDACWVLVHHPDLRRLLAPHGILVRDCANFGLPGIARVGVPGDDDRVRFLAVLDTILP